MYILSIFVKNYRFSKIYILKAENFLPWNEVTLEPHCGNILNQRMIFKDSIEEWICQMSLETISGEFWWKMGAYDHIKPLGLIQPPPRSLDRPESPVWLGLKSSQNLDSFKVWSVLKHPFYQVNVTFYWHFCFNGSLFLSQLR